MKSPQHSTVSDAKLKALLRGLREEVAAPRDFRAGVLARLRREGLLQPASGAAAPSEAPASFWGRLASPFLARPRWGLAVGSALVLTLVWTLHKRDPAPAAASVSPSISVSVPGPQTLQVGSSVALGRVAPPAGATSAHSAGASSPDRPALASRVRKPLAPFVQERGEVAELSVETQKQGAMGAQAPAAPSQSGSLIASAAPAHMAPPSGYSSTLGGGFHASAASSAPGAAAMKPSGQVLAQGPAPNVVIKPTATPLATPTQNSPAPSGQPNSQVRNNVILASRGQSAQILFTVAQAGPVVVEIYDRMGRPVAQMENGQMPAGRYSLPWSGMADAGGMAASGVYVVLIRTPTYVAQHKMLLVK